MILEEQRNYYEILELTPSASPQEIRSAYLRVKSAYKKDNNALYTLYNEEETQTILKRIEEAYAVLSNPDKRQDYDRNCGTPSGHPLREPPPPPPFEQIEPAAQNPSPETMRDTKPATKSNIIFDEKELETGGAFLKKIREAYKLSIDDLANQTKISKTYIRALEADDFSKLPAPVYTRGFVIQLAKALKLPAEKVAAAYMAKIPAEKISS